MNFQFSEEAEALREQARRRADLSGIGSNGVVNVHATTRNPRSFCETKIQVFNPSTILLACLETQCDHAVGVYFFGINPYGDVGFHLGPGL